MKPDYDGATCVVCGEEFTADEWEERHWPRDGGEAHAGCCQSCDECDDDEEEESNETE